MPEELEEKILAMLQNSTGGSILQCELWKALDSGSREVSRSIVKMERRNLVKREPVQDSGRKTYLVILLRKVPKIDLADVSWCACLTCPDLSRCGRGQPISPEDCQKLSISLRNEFWKHSKGEELQKLSSTGNDVNAK